MNYFDYMEWTRKFRSKYLGKIAKKLVSKGITANQLTTLGHFLGLLSVYFLFNNHLVFVILFSLHLSVDAFDGVVARLTKQTVFGNYYDHIGDQVIAFSLLLRIYTYLADYYILIVLGIFIITNTIYFLSKMKTPVIFVRSVVGIALMCFPLSPMLIINGAYLVSGVILMYSLARQLIYYLTRRFS